MLQVVASALSRFSSGSSESRKETGMRHLTDFQQLNASNEAQAAEKGLESKVAPRLSQSASVEDLNTIKLIIQARRKRAEHFPSAMFADPAWDILLELARAEIQQLRTTTSNLCEAAAVPATTALRWINSMIEDGALARRPDSFDRRRIYVELTYSASVSMKSYLSNFFTFGARHDSHP
jgi:DNA-binding MarR family transcriptional regulator